MTLKNFGTTFAALSICLALSGCVPLHSIVVIHYRELAHSTTYLASGILAPPIFPGMFRVYEIVRVENQAVAAKDFTFTLQKVFPRGADKNQDGQVLNAGALNPKPNNILLGKFQNPNVPSGQVLVAAGQKMDLHWLILVRTNSDFKGGGDDAITKETLADLGYVPTKDTSVLMTRDPNNLIKWRNDLNEDNIPN